MHLEKSIQPLNPVLIYLNHFHIETVLDRTSNMGGKDRRKQEYGKKLKALIVNREDTLAKMAGHSFNLNKIM